MKKISALLLFLLPVFFAYAQTVEMTTVIPTTPSVVVDELRVIGGNTNSNVGTMNIGIVPNDTDTPFQSQTLRVAGNTSITSAITSGRDLFVREPLRFSSINIGEGNVFTDLATFPNVEGGTFRAKTIGTNNQSNASSVKVNTLSGKEVKILNAVVEDPFGRGATIAKRKNVYIATEQTSANQNKYHIYKPWGALQTTAPTNTPKCNNSGALCTKNNCSACTSGGATVCYDVRERTFPLPQYYAAGAIYEKIGTAKFYCKPSDTFNEAGNLNSSCRHYMVYSGRNTTASNTNSFEPGGFTSGTGAIVNPFNNINTTNAINSNLSPAEKCSAMCSASGCTNAQAGDYFVAVDAATTQVVDFTAVFNENCQNANSSWPAGSGLSCQAGERVIDIYVLRCYQGSGRLARPAGTYYQQRQVVCKQYSNVYGHESGNVNQIKDRYFFYPDFALSFSNAYDRTTLEDLGAVAVQGGTSNF